jgi:hypothetical protein
MDDKIKVFNWLHKLKYKIKDIIEPSDLHTDEWYMNFITQCVTNELANLSQEEEPSCEHYSVRE